MARLLLCFVGGLVASCAGELDVCRPPSPHRFIQDTLVPQDYDSDVAPGVFANAGSTKVEVQFNMVQLTEINEKAGSLIATGYLRLFWQDDRLAFNNSGCDELINLRGSNVHAVWVPDLYIENLVTREQGSELDKGSALLVYPDGLVVYSTFRVLNTYLGFTFEKLPVDSHTATIKVGTFSQDIADVRLAPRSGSIEEGPSGEGISSSGLNDLVFSINDNEPFSTTGDVSIENGRSFVTLSFEFRRRPLYYVRQVIYPSILFLLIAYLQFWVPAEATPARALLATLPVLIFTNLSNGLYSTLPKGSQTMELQTYLDFSLYLCVASSLHFALVQGLGMIEARRRERRAALIMAKGAINKMADMARNKKVAMKVLLKEFMPQTLEVEARESDASSASQMPIGDQIPGASDITDMTGMDTERRKQAIVDAGFKEKDLVILRIALQYFEECDADHSGELAIPELRRVFRRFDWYLTSRQLARAACAFAKDKQPGRKMPARDIDFEMKFITFAPFMVEAEQYMKLFQIAKPVQGFEEWWQGQSPSILCDKVMRYIYPMILVALLARLAFVLRGHVGELEQ